MESKMKVYAEYFIENGMTYRMNTILQFGDSWELIGNIVLANPGSAEPTKSMNDVDKKRLEVFYKNYKNDALLDLPNWYEFSADPTMKRVEKIFNGAYVDQAKKLNGVIQLFNTFNIKNQDLEEAISQIDINSSKLFSKGIEKYFHDKTTYFGFGKDVTSNETLRPIAENIFNNSSVKVKNIYNNDFSKNSFYHPSYINRAINQDHFQCYKEDILKQLLKDTRQQ